MMRAFFALLLLLATMLPAHAGEFWSSLWRNADQRGEALLQKGDASTAATVYADPRRKAYAKLKAGDYQGAAQDLDKLHDSEAGYNRGNALAHAGNLQGALDAYDAALKHDPQHRDARHNRELVASALKQQPPQQQKSGDNKSQNENNNDKKDGQQDKGQDSSGQGKDTSDQNNQDDNNKAGEQGKNDPQGKSGQADNKSGKDKNTADHTNPDKQDQQSQQGKPEQKSENGKSQNENKQAGQDKSKEQASGKNGAQAGEQKSAKDDAEQARRDAEASLAKPAPESTKPEGTKPDGTKGNASGGNTNAGIAMPANASKSEQQIAQEQWLRSIPDDPGGLLRRKFLIQHMMRQQKAQQ